MLSYISHGKGDLSGYFLKFSQSFHLQPFITSVIAVENKNLERIAKRGIKIKRYAARKKADPQAVQRGRLFRAALFACFSV